MEILKSTSLITFDDIVLSKWGWFIALGVSLIALGGLAFNNVMTATNISILYVGAVMIIGSIVQLIHSVQVKRWRGFIYFLISGVLYGTAGILAFQDPLLAAASLTLLLSFALIASGSMRIWSGFKLQPQIGWGWALASGVTTFSVGLVIIIGWPIDTLWLLGMMLAIELILQGVAAFALGIRLKKGSHSKHDLLPRNASSH